jgi:acetolactate synthase small subunit
MVSRRKAYDQAVRKLDGLIDLRAAGEITQEEFSHRRIALRRISVTGADAERNAPARR